MFTEDLLNKKEKLAVVGLGYVGLPLAVTFADRGVEVVGFDTNTDKIQKYIAGEDPTHEIGNDRLKQTKNITFTSDQKKLSECRFIIVAVPTPVGINNIPNLKPVEGASELIGKNLTKQTIVVYESTVYPGVTEEICVPILEKCSGLKCGVDFKVGYSPERINPGDKVNTVENIIKIVSGMDSESLEVVAAVYELVIKAGVHRATTIKVAEAAKVIENSQRDVNIAFVNELSMIFDKMGIDTKDVLEAAGTKWNFLRFQPGLVGGHCIGVDPYYLTYKSEELGHLSQLILSGRRINDGMSKFVAEKAVKMMIHSDIRIRGAKLLMMGLTFKENVPDLRNSKVADVIRELREFGVNVIVTDPVASDHEAEEEYGFKLTPLSEISDIDGIIIAVNHADYLKLSVDDIRKLCKTTISKPVLIDIKGILNKSEAVRTFNYWRM